MQIILHLLEEKEFILHYSSFETPNLESELLSDPLEMRKDIKKGFDMLKLTYKGNIALCLREVPCLIFSEWVISGKLFRLTSVQLIVLLSCFTNINVQDDLKDWIPKTEDSIIQKFILDTQNIIAEYQKIELDKQINTGTDYTIHYDLMNYVEEWTKCDNVEQCKALLQKLESEKEIFLGEFVKALIKINNICSELEKIAEIIGSVEFLSKLRDIPQLIMKYVVTNQSLYI